MALIDKNQVEDIKKTVTEKVDDYKKEVNKANKIKIFELAFEMAKEKHRTGGYTDNEYIEKLNQLADGIGINL